MRNKDKKSIEKLQKIIIEEKLNGIPDIEIGKKYGVSYKSIENALSQSSKF